MNSTSGWDFLSRSRGFVKTYSGISEANKFFTLSQFVLTSIFLILLYGIFNRRIKSELKKRQPSKKPIPCYFHYRFFGLRLPQVLDSFLLLFQCKFSGIQFIERISTGLQKRKLTLAKMNLAHVKIISIVDPILLQKILSSNDPHVLNKNQSLYKFLLGPLSTGLVGNEVEIWRAHRKVVNKCFTYKILQGDYLNVLNKQRLSLSLSLLKKGKDEWLGGEETMQLIHFQASQTILNILIGDSIWSEKECKDLQYQVEKLKYYANSRVFRPYNQIPFVWWFNPARLKMKKHEKMLNQYTNQVIHHWRTMNADELQEETFPYLVGEMFRNKMSIGEIQDEVATFLLAGHETSVTAFEFFLQHIAEHPEFQLKCQEEIDSVLGTKKSRTLNDLSSLKFLERCILETLRLTPTVPAYARELSADMDFGEYHFEKGSVIAIPVWAIHRDPRNYPNPNKFDPDRFLPENIAGRNGYSFLAFSSGPRNCIGHKFAMMELKMFLVEILRNFEISTDDKVEDVPILFNTVIKPERHFKFVLKKRYI